MENFATSTSLRNEAPFAKTLWLAWLCFFASKALGTVFANLDEDLACAGAHTSAVAAPTKQHSRREVAQNTSDMLQRARYRDKRLPTAGRLRRETLAVPVRSAMQVKDIKIFEPTFSLPKR